MNLFLSNTGISPPLWQTVGRTRLKHTTMGRRVDGRASEGTLRPLSCELSTLHNADGSALWKSGSTHVLAAIHGPLAPMNMSKEEQERAIVSVVIKSGGRQDKTEYEWGEFLGNVLSSCIDREQYPRSVVEIVLQIIQADGSLLSCMLHAAVAALMDAGVELLYAPVATTCLLYDPLMFQAAGSGVIPSSSVFLDPCRAEEEEPNTSVMVLVNESSHPEKILGIHTIGHGVSLETTLACLTVAASAGPAIVAFWRLAVEQKVSRECHTLWSK